MTGTVQKSVDKWIEEARKQEEKKQQDWCPICMREGGGIGWFNGEHPACCGNCKA